MRKITTLLALFFASVLVAQAQSVVKQFTIKSKILGVEKEYSVYLPDGYKKTGEKYVCLFIPVIQKTIFLEPVELELLKLKLNIKD